MLFSPSSGNRENDICLLRTRNWAKEPSWQPVEDIHVYRPTVLIRDHIEEIGVNSKYQHINNLIPTHESPVNCPKVIISGKEIC